MDKKRLKSVIETLLFVYAEPMSLAKLSKLIGVSKDETLAALNELKDEYNSRGIAILEKDGEYELGSNPANAKFAKDLIKSEFSEELSRASLETLAIAAYRGPLGRAEIEFIRGVNSSFILRSLLMRGLVERIENPKDARAYLYKISFDFLKHFGLKSVEELPHFAEFKKEKIEILENGSTEKSPQPNAES